jgi:hypothetical protein
MSPLSNAGGGEVTQIAYAPGLIDTGDLELTTKTITGTSEPATDTWTSAALTLPAPTDARLQVLRIAAKLTLTIDSLTATHLYVRVYVDQVDVNHLWFDLDLGSPAAQKLASQPVSADTKSTIFNLLKDGASHVIKIRAWVDAGNAVISECRIRYGVGDTGATSASYAVMSLAHTGKLSGTFLFAGVATGNATLALQHGDATPALWQAMRQWISPSTAGGSVYGYSTTTVGPQFGLCHTMVWWVIYSLGTATDLFYISSVTLNLESG